MKSNQEKDIRPVVNLNKYPLSDRSFINSCRMNINRNGSVVLPDFLTESAVKDLINEKVKLPIAKYLLENNTPEKVKVTYDEVKDIVYIKPS